MSRASHDIIDAQGYRLNVGIILTNAQGRVFWGRRVGADAWQFPQGGLVGNESPRAAMYRELEEEVGLRQQDVALIGMTRGWLRYRLPRRFIRYHKRPLCIGQRQRWFVLRLLSADSAVRLDAGEPPEFDRWRWVEYWHPLQRVVHFKRDVYRRALTELAPLVGLRQTAQAAAGEQPAPESRL